MVSTLESSKHFPSHIRHLLADLGSGSEVIAVLSAYIPFLTSDLSLYYIFLQFGYSPEHGSFLSPPSSTDLASHITKEYHSSLLDIEENCNKSVAEVKKEFLRTFNSFDLENLVDPSDLDFQDRVKVKVESNSLWESLTPQKLSHSSFTTPSDINTPRVNKGLKILSKKIREILINKGRISYKEMADLVVTEMENSKEIDREKEGRNVLRRIYDSLNVLEACGVVGKSEKKYYWKGFPTPQSELNDNLALGVNDLKESVQMKRGVLMNLCKRYFSMRELIMRNKTGERTQEKIEFPFIIVSTEEHHLNKVRIESNKSRTDIAMKFHKEIKLFGDADILVQLGFHRRPMHSTDIPIGLFELLACKIPSKFNYI